MGGLTGGQGALQVQVRAEVTRRIQKLGRLGRAKEAVQELAQMARLGVQPDTQAATALLDACVRAGKLDMAQSVFEELFGAAPEGPRPGALVREAESRGHQN